MSNSYENTFNRMDKCDAYWHSKAGDLLISASILWNHKEEIGCWNTYKMLMGMSFELLIKAILIQSGISITHTHNLRNLANNIEVNLSKDELNLLDILSEYIIWAGKYPIPKKSESLEKLYKLEQKNLYDVVEKIGELELVSSNDKFDFDNLHKLWSKIAEKYRL
ncbi:HEPN domain-containing protein [Gallibacterium anatis]|uniref:HEPN domain-containing protein n=1 Tax=Gallibacterium anatis TaxID=750 RepID=UPI0009B88616|nr:HEPN domain-containing protein [Gallibacterium anatis]